MNEIIEKLKILTHDLGILYVEDNKGLRDNMSVLLAKLFPNVWSAGDGKTAYEFYKIHHPAIVLSDINMPEMSGLELARKIKEEDDDVRFIILSAFDEKEYLHEAIEAGVFRYATKPTKVPLLIDALYAAAVAINSRRDRRIFDNQLRDIFNYQNNLLIMLKEGEAVLVNQQFLDFFGVNSLDLFREKYDGFDTLLLEHQGFLYTTQEREWFKEATSNPGKLFHTKVLNHAREVCHLIMKLRLIPDKEGYTILSFDDITDLNLMMIFDNKTAKNDLMLQERSCVIKLMQVIRDNSAEVKLHNFYRGLTVVNSAVLVSIEDNNMILKTTYTQLKAIKFGNNITITSELFPYSVVCKSIINIDFDEQTVTFSDVKFLDKSADQRAFIRLEPEEKRHSITLFYREIKFFGTTRIVDISVCSVKIEIDALPAGLSVAEAVKITIVFDTDKQPLNFSITGTVYRIDNFTRNYHIVILFELSSTNSEKLTNYLAKRQLELIREFKAL